MIMKTKLPYLLAIVILSTALSFGQDAENKEVTPKSAEKPTVTVTELRDDSEIENAQDSDQGSAPHSGDGADSAKSPHEQVVGCWAGDKAAMLKELKASMPKELKGTPHEQVEQMVDGVRWIRFGSVDQGHVHTSFRNQLNSENHLHHQVPGCCHRNSRRRRWRWEGIYGRHQGRQDGRDYSTENVDVVDANHRG